MTTNPSNRRRVQTYGPILALFVGLVLSAVIGEVMLRWVYPQRTLSGLDLRNPRCFKESSNLPWELLPGARTRNRSDEYDTTVSINRQGLRMDRDVSRAVPEGKKRILIVGDSFVFGWGVEASESFSTLLERHQIARGRAVEVLNLGFSMGPAPPSYFVGLREPAFDADLVIVSVFVGNDITTPHFSEWTEVDESGLPKSLSVDQIRVGPLHRLRRAELPLRYRIPVLRDSHLAIGFLDGFDKLFPRVAKQDSGHTVGSMNPRQLYHDAWPGWLEESFQKVAHSLIAIGEMTKARGQQYLVMIIPDPKQLYRTHLVEGGVRLGEPRRANTTAVGVPQQRLIDVLEQEEIETLDLLPHLYQAMAPDVYFPIDQHFTAHGHQLVAAILDKQLEGEVALDP